MVPIAIVVLAVPVAVLAGGGEGERLGVVALGEFDQRLGFDGAFEMEVQLNLGKMAEPCGDIDFCRCRLATRHWI